MQRLKLSSAGLGAVGALALGLIPLSFATAQLDTTWTGAVDSDFLNDANWDNGAPISVVTSNMFVSGGDNLPIVIPADVGEMTLGAFQLGLGGDWGPEGGSVVQEGGTLNLSFFAGEPSTYIGRAATEPSSYVMNGGTILYDDPLGALGSGFGGDGPNGNDLEVGAQGPGTLEVHNDAVLRISDDLKIGAEANGDGMVLIDGDAVVTVGSGISVSEGDNSHGTLIVGGNALLESGNSAGAGNTEEGWSNEGYLTLSIRDNPAVESSATVIFRDNATVNVRTLQQRGSTSTLTVQDNAQFHIFDIFHGSGPETSSFGSHMAHNAFSDFTITLQDNAVMTVNSEVTPSSAGLIMSAAREGDNQGAGGTSRLEVLDAASLTIEQDLRMAVGTEETSQATFAKAGGSTATINGDLLMAVDDTGGPLTGFGQTATLEFILTGAEFNPIEVGGTAYLGNGHMTLVLEGYTPSGGETFELLHAGAIDGEFLSLDTTQAMLPGELIWDVSYSDTAVLLEVLGDAPFLTGDFNGNGLVEQEDLDLVLANWGGDANNVPANWINDLPEGNIDQTELDKVLANWGNTVQNAAGAVPEPATQLLVLCVAATSLSGFLRRRFCRTCP